MPSVLDFRNPPEEARPCQVCLDPVRKGEPSLLGQFHLGCLPVIEDSELATTYRTPTGGKVVLNKVRPHSQKCRCAKCKRVRGVGKADGSDVDAEEKELYDPPKKDAT